MISGASDEELDLANIRAEIMLATSVEHLKAVDDFYDKEIEKLNNIIKKVKEHIENINNKKIIDLNWELEELLKILDKED